MPPNRKCVLVADDNPLVRQALCRLFTNHATLDICDEAGDGQDAVEKTRRHRPDLIILDFAMPGMNGLAAAEAISKILPEAPIILLTAYARGLKLEDVAAMGITKVVSKDDPDLVRHVEELLDPS
jgi:two-component system response regulator DesR